MCNFLEMPKKPAKESPEKSNTKTKGKAAAAHISSPPTPGRPSRSRK